VSTFHFGPSKRTAKAAMAERENAAKVARAHKTEHLERPRRKTSLSEEGEALKKILAKITQNRARVSLGLLGRKIDKKWACYAVPTATGFVVYFRINSRDRESVVVLLPQDKPLRQRVDRAIQAWWQSLVPSDVIVPEE
jgi:hypothetical protein